MTENSAPEMTTVVLLTAEDFPGRPNRPRGALATLPTAETDALIAAGVVRAATDTDRALAFPNFGG